MICVCIHVYRTRGERERERERESVELEGGERQTDHLQHVAGNGVHTTPIEVVSIYDLLLIVLRETSCLPTGTVAQSQQQ